MIKSQVSWALGLVYVIIFSDADPDTFNIIPNDDDFSDEESASPQPLERCHEGTLTELKIWGQRFFAH